MVHGPDSRAREPEIWGQKTRAGDQKVHEAGEEPEKMGAVASQTGKKFSELNLSLIHI